LLHGIPQEKRRGQTRMALSQSDGIKCDQEHKRMGQTPFGIRGRRSIVRERGR